MVLCQVSQSKAEVILVTGAKIIFYAQSHTDSDAHMIQSNIGIYKGGDHPSCINNRLYINFADKEIIASALADSLANKSVSFLYDDAAESKHIAGHANNNCRVFSMWQQ
jgi:hypothetical protein